MIMTIRCPSPKGKPKTNADKNCEQHQARDDGARYDAWVQLVAT
jgi:hypothetical protein